MATKGPSPFKILRTAAGLCFVVACGCAVKVRFRTEDDTARQRISRISTHADIVPPTPSQISDSIIRSMHTSSRAAKHFAKSNVYVPNVKREPAPGPGCLPHAASNCRAPAHEAVPFAVVWALSTLHSSVLKVTTMLAPLMHNLASKSDGTSKHG